MRIVTARFVFGEEQFDEVPVLNPGGWAGRAWLVEVGAGVGPALVVVEADRPADALAALAASPRYGPSAAPAGGGSTATRPPAPRSPAPTTAPGCPPAGCGRWRCGSRRP